MATGASASAKQIVWRSIDFEIFGKVQGVFFRRDTRRKAKELALTGWAQNTSKGTVIGQAQGPVDKIKVMKSWLKTKGSPKSRIDKAVFSNEKNVDELTFKTFDIIR
ncbi:acylphosphatase-1 [Strongylocentrotus purpuratus]|uniref:Acylphosphatase n=1 Tax=Strongylocentrotus purpuratus TaxID=7668 RepID=A0A7M7RGL5_STRPU|nr:acylphosphatase-1 [Strongylocentrotus purpuratus]|eukprot:XP_792402.1 PREDICTED: acylphosphatase-1 [Strongylocentrotus purpuratus]